jgi:hypothetical protein
MTKEEAIKLAESKFWEKMSYREIATFQLYEDRLCMPFSVFHEAMEKVLERPVYSHEFGLNREALKRELSGLFPAPTLEEIMNMIPEEKRIVLVK